MAIISKLRLVPSDIGFTYMYITCSNLGGLGNLENFENYVCLGEGSFHARGDYFTSSSIQIREMTISEWHPVLMVLVN